MRPRLLDLFCGAGGAAVGYHRAGFDVVGVDLVMRRDYPFPRIQADVMNFLTYANLASVAAIHASPPCQAYSSATAEHARSRHPDLVGPVRDLLTRTGKPWIIENVPRAPLRADHKLCGCMFGLPNLRRERWFETSWHDFDLRQPCMHIDPIVSVVGGGRQSSEKDWLPREHVGIMAVRSRAMGIDWIGQDHQGRTDLALAVPPAYTEYLGGRLLAVAGDGGSGGHELALRARAPTGRVKRP